MNLKLVLTSAVLLVLCATGAWWTVSLTSHSTVSFAFKGTTYELLYPSYLALGFIVPLLWFGLRFSLTDLPLVQRAVIWLLRGSLLVLLALALARPFTTHHSSEVASAFLVDVSDSVSDEAINNALTSIRGHLEQAPADAEVSLISFAARPEIHSLPTTPRAASQVLPSVEVLRGGTAGAAKRDGTATNIQAALQLAYGVLPSSKLRRVLIYSDGAETIGDIAAETGRAREFGVLVFAEPYTVPPPAEMAVRELVVPNKITIGETFKVLARIYSTRAGKARLQLYQDTTLNGLGGTLEVDLVKGENTFEFQSVVRVGGEVTYRVALSPRGDDKFKENNEFAVKVDVPGRPMVLYVEGQPQRASYLASALTAQQFDVDVRPASAFPTSVAELSRYDFVILSDVPANQISESSQNALEGYLRDLGGGFLFAGGVAGYSLGGWEQTPLARIVPVEMDAPQHKEMPSVAVALVIDRSDSMAGLPLEMAKVACRATVETLRDDDLVEIIAFDQEPTRYVKMQPARYNTRIQSDISRIQNTGGTNFFPALDMAYQDISVAQARKKHVILLTDGRAEPHGLRDLVQAMLAESITVTTVGLGNEADVDLLRMIAETGGGRFHQAPDPNSLPRIFTHETEMITRSTSVQEWFPVTQTGSADFLKGIAIGTAPLLHGYVATQMKPSPAQELLATDTGDPLLARMRVGLGQSLAWTSDVKNAWAIEWLRWPAFSTFWGQLVREHMRQKSHRELDMKLSLVNNQLTASVDAFDDQEQFANNLRATLALKGTSSKTETKYPMRQVAPGRYQTVLELQDYGTFTLHGEYSRETEDGVMVRMGDSYGHVSNPYPVEYQTLDGDITRLQTATLAGGGNLKPTTGAFYDPQGESRESVKFYWIQVLFIALSVFVLDLLFRRVRVFDRKFR
jgi:Ca-activated chloride channel homolog